MTEVIEKCYLTHPTAKRHAAAMVHVISQWVKAKADEHKTFSSKTTQHTLRSGPLYARRTLICV